MSAAPRLVITTHGAIAELRLNRPEVRNAIDDALRGDLLRAIDELAASDEIRVVVLTGEGTAFCAGGDISGMRDRLRRPPTEVAGAGWRRLGPSQRLVIALHQLHQVTIAAVNGPASGYGVDLALACDFVVAAESAFFAMSYIQRGLVPDGGGMYFLPRRVGLARAKELILTGRRIDSAEALSLGLADRLVPAADLTSEVSRWAEELAKAPPVAAGLAKSILNRSLDLTAEDVMALSAQATAMCYTTSDHLRLVESFLEGRKKGG